MNFDICSVVPYSVRHSSGHTVDKIIIPCHTELFLISIISLHFSLICRLIFNASFTISLLFSFYVLFPASRTVLFCPALCSSSHCSSILSVIFDNILERALLDCVVYWKLSDIIFEASLSPPERYQIIRDSPEYCTKNGVFH